MTLCVVEDNQRATSSEMRFTVKPSQYDSVPTDLDQCGDGGGNTSHATEETPGRSRLNSGGPEAETSLLQAEGHPRNRKPSALEGDLEMLSRKSSGAAADPDAAIHTDDDVTLPISSHRAERGGSGDDISDDGRRSSTPPYVFPLEELETESKTDTYAVGTTSLLSGETLATRGLQYAARQRRRLVYKDGNCNISSRNVMERKRKYLVDIFTTLVDMRWRYNVLLFTAAFVVSWFAFSVVWFLIAYIHGDTEHADDDDWKPCAAHVYDYPTALLFSMETQTTIGYG
jgi:hypothetical protein